MVIVDKSSELAHCDVSGNKSAESVAVGLVMITQHMSKQFVPFRGSCWDQPHLPPSTTNNGYGLPATVESRQVMLLAVLFVSLLEKRVT